jgi:hypothetical protein
MPFVYNQCLHDKLNQRVFLGLLDRYLEGKGWWEKMVGGASIIALKVGNYYIYFNADEYALTSKYCSWSLEYWQYLVVQGEIKNNKQALPYKLSTPYSNLEIGLNQCCTKYKVCSSLWVCVHRKWSKVQTTSKTLYLCVTSEELILYPWMTSLEWPNVLNHDQHQTHPLSNKTGTPWQAMWGLELRPGYLKVGAVMRFWVLIQMIMMIM